MKKIKQRDNINYFKLATHAICSNAIYATKLHPLWNVQQNYTSYGTPFFSLHLEGVFLDSRFFLFLPSLDGVFSFNFVQFSKGVILNYVLKKKGLP